MWSVSGCGRLVRRRDYGLIHPGVGHGGYPVGEGLLALRPFRLQGWGDPSGVIVHDGHDNC
jgi:hypothetical protein